MMRILQLGSQQTALEAAQLFTVFDTGLVEIIDSGKSLGHISERDLIQRVVALRLKPEEVTLGQLARSPLRL